MTVPLREFLRQDTVAARLQALRAPSVWRFLAAVLFNYALIALAITLAVWGESLLGDAREAAPPAPFAALTYGLVLLLAIVLIAARQHALLVLMHEGAHRSISRHRGLNDTLSDLLCGAPLLVSTRSYRRAHLAHHQHLNSAQDPDWCRKVDNKKERDKWLFPARVPLWRLLLGLYGHSVLYLLKSLADNQRGKTSPAQTHPGKVTVEPGSESAGTGPSDKVLALGKYVLYAVVGLALTLTSSWLGLLLFWIAPMLLVLPMIMRIRSIAEHFALRHDHPLRQTRTVRAGTLERLLLAPHHIGLHIDHHLLASVPFYQLPKLHQLLLECEDYRDNAHLNDGYFINRQATPEPAPQIGEGRAKGTASRPRASFAADLYGPPSEQLQPLPANQPPIARTAPG